MTSNADPYGVDTWNGIRAIVEVGATAKALSSQYATTKALTSLASQLKPYKDLSAVTEGIKAQIVLGDLPRLLKAPTEMAAVAHGADISRQIREAMMRIDLSPSYRELIESLSRGVALDWTRTAAGLVGGELSNALAGVAVELEPHSAADETEPVSRWLAELPPLAQRRLLLWVLNAILLVTKAAENPQLDNVIAALLGLALVLNDVIPDPSSGAQPPAP